MLFCYDDFYFSLIFIIGVWFDRYCSFLSVHVSDDFIFLYGFNKYIFEICLLDLSWLSIFNIVVWQTTC